MVLALWTVTVGVSISTVFITVKVSSTSTFTFPRVGGSEGRRQVAVWREMELFTYKGICKCQKGKNCFKSHGLEEEAKKFRRLEPNAYRMHRGASFLPGVCKSSLINTFNIPFTFPNLVVFLTYAIMWCTGCFLMAPLALSSHFFPTHWQPLDLESAAVIVIYASSHDRSARIVLSIRPRRLKVTARLGFNHCILSRKKKEQNCHRTSLSIQPDHGLLLHAVAGRIQSLRSSVPWKKAILCQGNIRLECNHLLEAILSQGAEHTSLAWIFWVYWLKM